MLAGAAVVGGTPGAFQPIHVCVCGGCLEKLTGLYLFIKGIEDEEAQTCQLPLDNTQVCFSTQGRRWR